MTNDMVPRNDDNMPANFGPQSYEELMDFARMVAASGLAPKDYDGKPEKCAVAMHWGNELGLKPLQSLQNVAVVGNRPTLWGDAVLALVTSSPLCVDVIEWLEDEDTPEMTAYCTAKRHHKADKTASFSVQDAQTAGLIGKDVWQKYPKRMLQMRARGFALRDQFPDLLRGIPMTELVREAIDMGRVEEVEPDTGEIHPAGPPPNRSTRDRIKSKLKPVSLATVIKAIDSATSGDALKAAGEMAKRLSDDKEKEQARQHYQAKIDRERAAAAAKKGETNGTQNNATQNDASKGEPIAVTFAEVASSMEAALRRRDTDALAAAADLIAQVKDDQQQSELRTMFEGFMHKLEDGGEAEATT
ncbi:hypothetical protein [Caballeronia sp. INML1]|uniref:hypothetical protein n=1 Tax=Caballeronia sp. INML1 TaxID=2921760 RepID=UPI002027EACD|nr:hypothetical protein [Caballeronia sp. INML1]